MEAFHLMETIPGLMETIPGLLETIPCLIETIQSNGDHLLSCLVIDHFEI